MSRRTSPASLLASHYLAHPWRSAVVAVLVAVAVFLVTAAPRAAELVTTAELRDRLGAVAGSERDLSTEANGGILLGPAEGDAELPPPLTELYGATDAALERVRAGAGSRLAPLLGTADYAAVSRPFSAPADGKPEAAIGSVRFAFDPRIAERVSIADGASPVPFAGDGGLRGGSVPLEIMVSAETAERMQWLVGETRRVVDAGLSLDLRLTGTFEPVDAEARYWQHVTSVLTPEVLDDGNSAQRVTGTVYVDPASVEAFARIGGLTRLIAWYPFDPGAVSAVDAAELAPQLRAFTQTRQQLQDGGQGVGATEAAFSSEAAEAIQGTLDRSTSVASLLVLVGVGPLGVVVSLLALVATGVVQVRRPALVLAASRGAHPAALRGAVALEGLVVGIPAAAAGAFAALALVPGATTALTLLPAVALGLAPAAIFAVAATPPLGRVGRADLSSGRSGVLRNAGETLLVAVAVLSGALLVTRGLASDGAPNPLAIVAPLLLAIAVAIAVERLLPGPLLALQRRATGGTGLAAFVGVAGAVRAPIARVANLAVIVAVAVAVSSSILLTTLATGAAESATSQVGSDVRVEGPVADEDARAAIGALPGVAVVAGVDRRDPARIDDDGARLSATVIAIDGDAVAALHPEFPSSLDEVDGEAVPVVVSAELADELRSQQLELEDVPVHVAAVAQTDAGLGDGEWIAVDRAALERLELRGFAPRIVLVGLAPGGDAREVASAAAEAVGSTARTETRRERLADIEGAPILGALRFSLLVAIAVAAGLAATAIACSALLTIERRRTVATVLRRLGADRRQLAAVLAIEAAPLLVAGLLAGGVLGAALPHLVVAGLDLGTLLASEQQPAVQADPLVLALAALAMIAVAAASLIPALVTPSRTAAHPSRGGER